ncbi:MAG: hypothetical protein RIR70_1737, partial [Pseudomonadota bacterium]
MSQTIEVKVPDIGDYTDVPVIDLLVKVGDTVNAEDSLVTLESDKATMDVPAPVSGVVKALMVKLGDKVREGVPVVVIETAGGTTVAAPLAPAAAAPVAAVAPVAAAPAAPAAPVAAAAAAATLEVKVPDIGDYKDVPVIEVLVKVGDTVKAEDALVTLESDKATMDVPSPAAGVVQSVALKVGDKVAEGSLVLVLATSGAAAAPAQPASPATAPAAAPVAQVVQLAPVQAAPAAPAAPQGAVVLAMPSAATIAAEVVGGHKSHASPSVRRYARELGVDVAKVRGTGPKGRVLQIDVQAYV